MKLKHLLAVLLASPAILGCVSLVRTTPELDALRPRSVQVLPVTDVAGGADRGLVRELVVDAFEDRGYVVSNPSDATVQATVLRWRDILQFDSRTGAAEVRIQVEIFDAASGERLWSHVAEASRGDDDCDDDDDDDGSVFGNIVSQLFFEPIFNYAVESTFGIDLSATSMAADSAVDQIAWVLPRADR